MTRVFVTGADGFIGRAVCQALARKGYTVVAATRRGDAVPGAAEVCRIGDIGDATARNWDQWVGGMNAIVHLAARVHIMNDHAEDPLWAFRRVNTEATRLLASSAQEAGVQRFIFLSSIKVNGEETTTAPFTESDPARPEDAYGRSKWEAEKILNEVGSPSSMEVVILRPPLVYGPNVKANFLSLLKVCDTGLPLPFGGMTTNRRSFLYVQNLAQAICQTIGNRAAAGRTYLLSDGPPVSTAELAGLIRTALGRPARLLPLPPGLCRGILARAGKGAMADRLMNSLAVDDRRIRADLEGWPPFSLQEGLRQTIDWYRQSRP